MFTTAGDRTVEIYLPLGMELDEDSDGNAYVKSIEPNGRAAKTGKIFVGDRIAMVSATFGDDMWTCRGGDNFFLVLTFLSCDLHLPT